MMMTILSPAARRIRSRGRLRLVVLAAAMGLSGGAWAATRTPSLHTPRAVEVRTVDAATRGATHGVLRKTARAIANGLYAFADGDLDRPPPSRRPILLAGGPVPIDGGGLKIQITDAWAMPGAQLAMSAPEPFADKDYN